MITEKCPAAPIVHVLGHGVDVAVRLDSDEDKEIAHLAMEMADRHSRPTIKGTTHDQA